MTTTLGKANVGLDNLGDLDSTANSKLGGIAAGATVGATLGSTGNLLREDGSTKATDADVITSQGTANNVSNVGNQSVANAQTAVIAANAGLTSAGVVNKFVPKKRWFK